MYGGCSLYICIYMMLCICLPLRINPRNHCGSTYLERPKAHPIGRFGLIDTNVYPPTLPPNPRHLMPTRCSRNPHHSPTPYDLVELTSTSLWQYIFIRWQYRRCELDGVDVYCFEAR